MSKRQRYELALVCFAMTMNNEPSNVLDKLGIAIRLNSPPLTRTLTFFLSPSSLFFFYIPRSWIFHFATAKSCRGPSPIFRPSSVETVSFVPRPSFHCSGPGSTRCSIATCVRVKRRTNFARKIAKRFHSYRGMARNDDAKEG